MSDNATMEHESTDYDRADIMDQFKIDTDAFEDAVVAPATANATGPQATAVFDETETFVGVAAHEDEVQLDLSMTGDDDHGELLGALVRLDQSQAADLACALLNASADAVSGGRR